MVRGTPGQFEPALREAMAGLGVTIEPRQVEQLRTHFEAMVEANRVMNLTRIINPVAAAVKHYADSLALLCWVRDCGITVESVLDIGTGAGFPAVPLAVMRPDWSVTAIDATRKKIDFVRRTAASIGLQNLHCDHAHSEHWEPSTVDASQSATNSDLVVFRALRALAAGLKTAVQYAAPGGWLVAYKTELMGQTERADADMMARALDLTPQEPYAYQLQLGDVTLERVLYVFQGTG